MAHPQIAVALAENGLALAEKSVIKNVFENQPVFLALASEIILQMIPFYSRFLKFFEVFQSFRTLSRSRN